MGILAGHVHNPKVFCNALNLAYTDVLIHTQQAPDADDMVKMQLQHSHLKLNGGCFSE